MATTRTAAELLGVEADVGTLEPGKLADIVLVDGDPRQVDTLPDRIRAVYIGGRSITHQT